MEDIFSMVNMQVISGGQTGVDLAGLRAAKCLGFRTGGIAPANFKTQAGHQPSLSMFGLIEGVGGYASRTRKNVDLADMTLIIAADVKSAGTKLTIKTAEDLSKPIAIIELALAPIQTRYQAKSDALTAALTMMRAELRLALESIGTFALNVAGNSSSSAPGIFPAAFLIMVDLLTELYKSESVEQDPEFIARAQKFNDIGLAFGLNDNYQIYQELDPKLQRLVITS